MARESRTNLKTSDFLIIKSQLDGSILKIVTPQHFEVGFDDDEFQRVVLVHGSVQSTKGVFSPVFSPSRGVGGFGGSLSCGHWGASGSDFNRTIGYEVFAHLFILMVTLNLIIR